MGRIWHITSSAILKHVQIWFIDRAHSDNSDKLSHWRQVNPRTHTNKSPFQCRYIPASLFLTCLLFDLASISTCLFSLADVVFVLVFCPSSLSTSAFLFHSCLSILSAHTFLLLSCPSSILCSRLLCHGVYFITARFRPFILRFIFHPPSLASSLLNPLQVHTMTTSLQSFIHWMLLTRIIWAKCWIISKVVYIWFRRFVICS